MKQNKKTKIMIFSLNHAIYLNLLKKLSEWNDIKICAVFETKKIKENYNFDVKTIKYKNFFFSLFSFAKYIPRSKEQLSGLDSDIVISKLYYSFQSFQVYRFAKKQNARFFVIAEEKNEVVI